MWENSYDLSLEIESFRKYTIFLNDFIELCVYTYTCILVMQNDLLFKYMQVPTAKHQLQFLPCPQLIH